jgi:hypothetical protein
LGPIPEYPRASLTQAPGRRRRLCLLKGCERPFRPPHPLSRYCSTTCRQAARRWSQRRANQHYRTSDHGRFQRRGQSRRRRLRAAERCRANSAREVQREGYQETSADEKTCCARPGCYESFTCTSRSPLQKFCSTLCRRALWRVRQREWRWFRRWGLSRATFLRWWNRHDP